MSQDIVNNNQSISYTNLDFASIYTEVLNLVKDLTYRWDPSVSDESDPGVILAKLSALIADKCNYNIDKSILEAFPLSVTQDANAQQLYEQLGYYMNWYESASTPVVLSWISSPDDDNSEIEAYTIPKFTIITNDEGNINYALVGVEGANGLVVSDGILTTDSKDLRMIAMEGTPARYSYLNTDFVITAQMVDKYTHRIYFNTPNVAQNGIFITNTNQNNYADWKRVDNIYEQSYNELRYKFGYDNNSNSCYLEFPDNYSELFGDGIEITYLELDDTYNDIPAQSLVKFLVGINPQENPSVLLDVDNVSIQNYAAASGHKDKEGINEAYENYKKTVGTFKTLITLRDYLNYIKSHDLDICSNAFVCDRTNDIQSSYKIVSKQHDLDSIIIKVEQVIDKTIMESNFDYKFELTSDESAIPGKPYYTITNDTLSEVEVTVGVNPKNEGWYEFVSRVASSHDALTPFSLKFYLLNNSIALNNKQAFNETFDMSTQDFDFDSLLSDTAHIEHTYEDILPLGKDTYKVTDDGTFLANKAYYIKSNDNINYTLYTDYEIGDSTYSPTTTFYEVDVEALLPHIVMFKNIYPLSVEILTYDKLNKETQEIIQKNVISALYSGVNSSQLNFGESINLNYISDIIKSSDDRIKEVKYINIPYYTTKAIYYDDLDKEFKEITLSSDSSTATFDQKDLNSILARLVEKDIICKSILSGVTSLLTPDDAFIFHLNQSFINYFENVYSITSQAVIDIGGKDAITTYSSDATNPFIRQSYALKPNEVISLYRPQLETIREFSAGIHFECFLYNDLKAGQAYELQKNEYIIFYQSYYADTSSATTGVPSGFSVYACTEGVIINPSFDIRSQTNFNSLTSFARGKVIPNFDTTNDNWYETSTYAYSYVVEIYNNSSIINNSITGTNTIKIQTLYTVDIELSDNYKFFWVLQTPHYSNDKTLKTYTLFPEYDVETDRLADKEKNSYTLKDGEWLYYVDSSFSNLAILGAGTTIYRNCGLNAEYNDDEPIPSFSYVNINEFNTSGTDLRFNDGILETITTQVMGEDVINPKLNGWYEAQGTDPETYERSLDTVYNSSKDYYVIVMDDNSGLYKRIGDEPPYEHSSTVQTSDVFSEINLDDYLCNVDPQEKGWYEIVTCMDSRVTDFYALSEGASYNNYLRYTKSLDESILKNSRFIFSNSYTDVDISDTSTYITIGITQSNSSDFDYVSQRLVVPTNGDNSYKAYYTDNTGTTRITDLRIIDNPSDGNNNHTGSRWYEESSEGVFTETDDRRPQLLSEPGSLTYPTSLTENYCFDEVYINDWNTRSFLNNGYFYKVNSADSEFIWDIQRSNVDDPVTSGMLSHLLTLYKEGKNKYTTYDDPSNPVTDYTAVINYIILNWKTSIAYNHPFKLEDKCGWRAPIFRVVGSGETAEYLGISSNTYLTTNGIAGEAYPKFDISSNIDVVVPASVRSSLPDGSIIAELVKEDRTNYPTYIEILNRVSSSDSGLCAYLEYLNSTFGSKLPTTFGMELQVKLFKFKDLYRLPNKSYFTPNIYVSKTFAPVDAWTCEALDNDEIANDPVNTIKDKWQSIQDNTSIRIVQNEMWSFSEGDVLRFEAPVASQNSIVWPRFSNTEIPLDLDCYSISYQRKGSSIEDIDKLSLEEYDWRGYSHLLLNTSSKDGQKLESNHSIILYTFNGSQFEEITTINGSDYENTTFQLKTPVNNTAGRYIDVTSENIYGEAIPNSVYEFIPLTNVNDSYAYTSDYNTHIYFEVDDSKNIINNQVKIPLLLPKGNYILPVHTETEGVRYKVTKYIEAHKDSLNYCINMSPIISSDTSLIIRIGHNMDSISQISGEQLYGYDKDKFVGLSDSNFYINDNKYHYLDVSVDINPASEDYIKVALPAHITEYYSGSDTWSPQAFGWYELQEDGTYELSTETGTGADLLEEVSIDTTDYNVIQYTNPCELCWYELNAGDPDYYTLSTDTQVDVSKTYYKDKDFYVSSDDVDTPVLKINADNPLLPIDVSKVDIIFGDIYKYKDNEVLSKDLFDGVRLKLRRLDDESLYNYAFRPDENDEIEDPLDYLEFFRNTHPYNDFVIPQLDFDNLTCKFNS